MKTHVVKIGGSLLDLPDLPDRFQSWRQERTDVHHLLIVGGGSEVNALRKAHAEGTLNEEQAHWQAIEQMDQNTRRLAEKVESVSILCVTSFLRHVEPFMPGTKLPIGWEVTSDSIAARVAIAAGAEEIHLFKSRLPTVDESQSLETLIKAGYVDPFMLQLAEELPKITAWNLREEPAGAVVL